MSNARKIVIPLDQVNEGLRLVANNIRAFIQDHYALMQQGSTWHAVAIAIFALEELTKYHQLKRQKETATCNNLQSVEVDERLFGYGRSAHEFKLKIAKEEQLIPSEAWTINTAKFDSAFFDSAYFDTKDVVIDATLRTTNWYVDWKNGKWQIGTEALETLRLKNFADAIIVALEHLEENNQFSSP
jgi:AbiV family abortive infection protein